MMEVYGIVGERPRAIDSFSLFRPAQSWHQASEGTTNIVPEQGMDQR